MTIKANNQIRRRVGPQTKERLPPQSVSDGCLTINVCGRAHRGPVEDPYANRTYICI